MNVLPIILLLYQQNGLMEEEMSSYTSDDLSDDWEFKIVRATMPVFNKPEILQQLINEESRAGWTMLEKFDVSRIRFKRRRQEHERDEHIISAGIDPYRTTFGHLPNLTKIVQMVILTLAIIIICASTVGFMIGLTALW